MKKSQVHGRQIVGKKHWGILKIETKTSVMIWMN